jgi:hypothetical protein
MKTGLTQMALTAMLSLGMTTVAYAVDRVGSGATEGDTTPPAAQKKGERTGDSTPSAKRPAETSGSGATEKSSETEKELSTPSKLDSGAPGTPGGATPGTSSGTETAPKTGSGK